MPWHVSKTEVKCSPGKPWAVIKNSDGTVVPGGCHATKEDAQKHMAALYASTQGEREQRGTR